MLYSNLRSYFIRLQNDKAIKTNNNNGYSKMCKLVQTIPSKSYK